jgi:hypothetical protein
VAHTPGFEENAQFANGSDADRRRTVSEEFRKSVTPFGGWVRDERSGRLHSLDTGPHIGGFAPPDTGIAAADGDDHVGGLQDLVGTRFGVFVAVRPIRDEIEGRVRRLLAELAIPYQASPTKPSNER